MRGLSVLVGLVAIAIPGATAETATSVAVGYAHACAVTPGGGVRCWGDNSYGQLGDGTTTRRATPTPVSGLSSNVVAATAGETHSCVVTSVGAVLCWGRNSDGQVGDGATTQRLTPTPVVGLSSGTAAVAAGNAHTCALTTGGAVACWGDNSRGQLGDGTVLDRPIPVPVSTLPGGVTAIAAGADFTCALRTGGGVQCWGANWGGQLGDGTTTSSAVPTEVSGLSSGATRIAAGGGHACAITTGGSLSCWGSAGSGGLGDGNGGYSAVPVAVIGLAADVTSVGVGFEHTCAVTTGGAVRCWGYNQFGQVGDGTSTTRLTPTPVSGLAAGVSAVAGGSLQTCALMVSGEVRCWGGDGGSQLGLGSVFVVSRRTPWPISGFGSGLARVAAGEWHTCGLTTTGGVKCWGSNFYGQLGDGARSWLVRPVPLDVSGLADGATAIAVGKTHTCALAGGAVKCWGQNTSGQLGDGTVIDRPIPTQVSGLTGDVVAIAAGDSHTCALTSGGGVICWGANWYGQLGDGTTTNRLTPTDVGGMSSGIAGISVFGPHTCVTTTAGAVKCWGYNRYGQLGDGTTTDRWSPAAVERLSSGVLSVETGSNFSCALIEGGTVACWGQNNSGQLGDTTSTDRAIPTPVNNLPGGVSALSVGSEHVCIVTSDGGSYCWGLNSSGQLGDGTALNRTIPTAVSGLATRIVSAASGYEHVVRSDDEWFRPLLGLQRVRSVGRRSVASGGHTSRGIRVRRQSGGHRGLPGNRTDRRRHVGEGDRVLRLDRRDRHDRWPLGDGRHGDQPQRSHSNHR